MTVAFVAASNVVSANGTGNVTIPKPAGVAQGDLLVLQYVGANLTTPAGWALIRSDGNAALAPYVISYLLYRVATAAEPASYVIGAGAAGYYDAGAIAVYRGGAADGSAGQRNTASSTAQIAPSAVASKAGLALRFFTTYSFDTTMPTGVTGRYVGRNITCHIAEGDASCLAGSTGTAQGTTAGGEPSIGQTLVVAGAASFGSVVVGGVKKQVATASVVVGGVKKPVTAMSVIVGGVKKPLA